MPLPYFLVVKKRQLQIRCCVFPNSFTSPTYALTRQTCFNQEEHDLQSSPYCIVNTLLMLPESYVLSPKKVLVLLGAKFLPTRDKSRTSRVNYRFVTPQADLCGLRLSALLTFRGTIVRVCKAKGALPKAAKNSAAQSRKHRQSQKQSKMQKRTTLSSRKPHTGAS